MNSSYWRQAGVVAARSCRGRGELEMACGTSAFFNVNLVKSQFQSLKSKGGLKFETFFGIGVTPKHL